jgi:hypothetical protein
VNGAVLLAEFAYLKFTFSPSVKIELEKQQILIADNIAVTRLGILSALVHQSKLSRARLQKKFFGNLDEFVLVLNRAILHSRSKAAKREDAVVRIHVSQKLSAKSCEIILGLPPASTEFHELRNMESVGFDSSIGLSLQRPLLPINSQIMAGIAPRRQLRAATCSLKNAYHCVFEFVLRERFGRELMVDAKHVRKLVSEFFGREIATTKSADRRVPQGSHEGVDAFQLVGPEAFKQL